MVPLYHSTLLQGQKSSNTALSTISYREQTIPKTQGMIILPRNFINFYIKKRTWEKCPLLNNKADMYRAFCLIVFSF